MIYLMSDVHGYSNLFFKMLEKIRLSEQDRLYILGDAAAKGPDSLGIFRYIMEHENVYFLRGNHEQRLLQYFETETERKGTYGGQAGRIPSSVMEPWVSGDGAPLIRQLLMCGEKERERILDFLSRSPVFSWLEHGGRKYLLVHGAPGKDGSMDLVLENRYETPDGFNRISEEVTVIVGHTPTFKYGDRYAGKIICKKDKIFLDCGTGQGYGLGCLRLDDMAEFYCFRKTFPKPSGYAIIDAYYISEHRR